ncbi:zinc-ribbon domain-containing protein, partial [Rhodoferax sp.]|uniref:zinc-ribbon domain-containing protein n=1 Tax=Rhodoferax sp. TaxID=50421 RepID=UPI0025E53BBA
MSFIARCPACQTSYKVVPDQLRISDGWVRCGQCGEVFDASQQLMEPEIDPSPDQTEPDDPALPHRSNDAGAVSQDETTGLADPASGNQQLSSVEDAPVHPSAPESLPPDRRPE